MVSVTGGRYLVLGVRVGSVFNSRGLAPGAQVGGGALGRPDPPPLPLCGSGRVEVCGGCAL